MIWWILLPLFLLLGFTLLNDSDYCLLWIIPVIILLIVCLGFTSDAINTYKDLVTDKTKAEAYISELESVRNAYYKESISGTLVGGSLDNLKQSTNLSEYIIKCASLKAEYNSNLKGNKIYKTQTIYKFLGFSLFISDEVLKLEELK